MSLLPRSPCRSAPLWLRPDVGLLSSGCLTEICWSLLYKLTTQCLLLQVSVPPPGLLRTETLSQLSLSLPTVSLQLLPQDTLYKHWLNEQMNKHVLFSWVYWHCFPAQLKLSCTHLLVCKTGPVSHPLKSHCHPKSFPSLPLGQSFAKAYPSGWMSLPSTLIHSTAATTL